MVAEVQRWFAYTAPGGTVASRWVPAVFGTLVFAYGSWVLIKGAIDELHARLPGMMTLISLAISVAFVFSLAVTFGFPGSDLWELATLVTIMVLGHWLEMRSVSQAQGALKELAKLLPDTALRILGDRTETVAVSDSRTGDLESREAVQRLHEQGVEVMMMTGGFVVEGGRRLSTFIHH